MLLDVFNGKERGGSYHWRQRIGKEVCSGTFTQERDEFLGACHKSSGSSAQCFPIGGCNDIYAISYSAMLVRAPSVFSHKTCSVGVIYRFRSEEHSLNSSHISI